MKKLTKTAQKILALRYLQRDEKGKIKETSQDLFKRVAKNISLAEAKYLFPQKVRALMKKYNEEFYQVIKRKEFQELIQKKSKTNFEIKNTEKEFYKMMADLDFLPNSPTLFNAGRKLQQLAACFVLPVEDDLGSIFQTLHHTALIHKSGGGTGFSFSRLRPKGDIVRSTQGIASGPVSFMKIFDAATEQIKQGGKRRGANMGILRVDHPDIEEFVTIKEKEDVLQNFNLSVAVTDEFMKAVKENGEYDLINPHNNEGMGKRNARKMFQLISKAAWKVADPGVVFIDTINKKNPTPKLGKIESTNPCGEVPLLPYEACNLGSINLANFVKDKKVDYKRLRETTWKAVHFLDNVIDVSNFPFPEITAMVHGNRKIGLGVMGFADMLVQLELGYASEEALKAAEELMKFINEEAKKASVDLAKKRGVFPNFKGSIYNTGKKEDRVRNATRTSIAPAGTISIIAGCSNGIEPLFALAFTHRIADGKELFEINKYFQLMAKERKLGKQVVERVLNKGSVEEVKGVPEDLRKVFIIAYQIPAEYHVKMQAAFQKHTDNAVSKTVNLSQKATSKDIENVYSLAYELGCKGISVYREGSRKGQVLTVGKVCPKCE